MNWAYVMVVLCNAFLMVKGRPQIPEGLGDTIASIGGTAADLIK